MQGIAPKAANDYIIHTYYNHDPLVDIGLYIKMHGSCELPIFSAGKMRFYAQGLGFITQNNSKMG